jgi:cellulose synthase operon protein C
MTQLTPKLRSELQSTHHAGRIERMLTLGRNARTDANALALIDELAHSDVFERRLALLAQHSLRDGKRVLAFTSDVSASLRKLAFTFVPQVCDDAQALEALQVAFGLHCDRTLVAELSRADRRPVIDQYLDWLATKPGLHNFADLVPYASVAGVTKHLGRALERPSLTFWSRLARHGSEAMCTVLCERLRAVPGEPDAVTRQLIERHASTIIPTALNGGLELLDLLLSRGIRSQTYALVALGAKRPSETLALMVKHTVTLSGAPFVRSAASLSVHELTQAVTLSPALLGSAKSLIEILSKTQIDSVARAWCDVRHSPTWGFPLLAHITDPETLERAWMRWSVAARNSDGVIPIKTVETLPNSLREREARRHLHEVIALKTQPTTRMPFARFLPWEEADTELKSYIGHPEGTTRGLALSVMLAIPGLRPTETTLIDRALTLVTARKNEQDPVRLTMLQALVAWPRTLWRTEHIATIGRIVRDALDAGDLSVATAMTAEQLVLRVFRLDPPWAAQWLATLIKERGTIYNPRIGEHLTDDEIRAAAPHLLAIAKTWTANERVQHLMALCESLGARLMFIDGLCSLLDTARSQTPWSHIAVAITQLFARHNPQLHEATLASTLRSWLDKSWYVAVLSLANWQETPGKRYKPVHPEIASALEVIARGKGNNGEVIQAVTCLRMRALGHFDRILGDLLAKDESYVCIAGGALAFAQAQTRPSGFVSWKPSDSWTFRNGQDGMATSV